ncbi:MAG: hypothetical protein NT076_05560 [Candidatus Pacearchaeota archaeon]|nr:hypothetical protein [Candidatus Pacearchaeota archaeon]
MIIPLDLNAYNGALRLAQITGSRIEHGFETLENLQKQINKDREEIIKLAEQDHNQVDRYWCIYRQESARFERLVREKLRV